MPTRLPETFASAADRAACRSAIRAGSRSFFAASLLLPAEARDNAYALYGFCRAADDAVDRSADPAAAHRALRARLAAIHAGAPADDPFDRAFADAARACGIARALPEALLEGMEWDAAGRRYQTLSELKAYAARVAGTVGAMMTLAMGVRAEPALARACDLGVAMQLTNIARDVGEDARAGRLYLPRRWMREAGLDPDAWLARPVFDPRLGAVVRRLLAEADALYRRAAPGVAMLPLACRPAIHAARLIYAEIGAEIARRGHDSVNGRAVTTPRRKAALMARAIGETFGGGRGAAAPALRETRFLVEAANPVAASEPIAWWRMGERLGRAADLLRGLELRDRAAAGRR